MISSIGNFLKTFHAAVGSWADIPDAMAMLADGRIAFRDAKRAGKDALRETQHNVARLAERMLVDKADFAVVEWDYKVRTQ